MYWFNSKYTIVSSRSPTTTRKVVMPKNSNFSHNKLSMKTIKVYFGGTFAATEVQREQWPMITTVDPNC